jgi:hypothetical protein
MGNGQSLNQLTSQPDQILRSEKSDDRPLICFLKSATTVPFAADAGWAVSSHPSAHSSLRGEVHLAEIGLLKSGDLGLMDRDRITSERFVNEVHFFGSRVLGAPASCLPVLGQGLVS